MENELTHWGIPGMKWGIRRYQNKDGSLTSAGKKRYSQEESEEAKKKAEEEAAAKREATRAKLLKSTNAEELYKHRDLLTTAEINERLNRIDTERRLAEVASKGKKTALDKLDTVLKYGKKANEVYQFMDTPMMKAAMKKITGDTSEENHGIDLRKLWENKDKMTDEQLKKALKRLNTEKSIKKIVDENDQNKTAMDAAKAALKKETDKVNDIIDKDPDILNKTIDVIKETKLDKAVGNLAKDTSKVVGDAINKAKEKNAKMSDIEDDDSTLAGQQVMKGFFDDKDDDG